MTDSSGVSHRLRYKNGVAQVKTPANGNFKTTDLWVEVKPLEQALIECEISRSLQGEYCRVMDAKRRGGTGAMIEELTNAIQEAHTGNHHSKPKSVRIPTKAGEPVRG